MKTFRMLLIFVTLFVIVPSTLVHSDDITLPVQESPHRELLGLRVVGFFQYSTLEMAGARVGDMITHYNGIRLESLAHLLALRDLLEDDEAEVVLMRGAEEIRVHVPRGLLGVQVREIAPEHLIDSDAVVIGGFGHLGWGQGMENSFLGCVMLLEGKYGAKLSYADIVGLSGYGFRVHFYPGFCFSSVDATCGRDIGGEILTRLGYEFEVFSLPDSDEASQDEMAKAKEHLLKKVKTSIDSGWPVIAINLIDADEWGVIAGYQKNGGELFCRTYFDLTEGYEIAQNVPWTIYAIKGKRKIKLGDEYRRSLSVAKELSERDNYGKYGNGTNAVILWMKILQDDEFFNSMDQRKLYTTMHMNWWIYHSLAEARALNGQFLMANKKRFDVDEKAIEDLAKLMEKESTLLANNLSSVPSLWEYENASVWTRDLRKQQVETLADFLELEKAAQQILRAEI